MFVIIDPPPTQFWNLKSILDALNLTNVASWASIVSLFWTAYLALKVRTITAERTREREAFGKALSISNLEAVMNEVAEALVPLETDGSIAAEARRAISESKTELVRCAGEVSGVLRAVSEYFDQTNAPATLTLIDDYFSSAFMVRELKRSKHFFRVICVRTIRVTEAEFLTAAQERVYHGCTIEIMALSDSAPKDIVEHAIRMLPIPSPRTLEDYVTDMQQGKQRIQRFADQLAKHRDNFRYYEFRTLPNIHMVQADNDIYLGFQYFALLEEHSLLRKLALHLPARSPIGAAIAKQFDDLKKRQDTVQLT
jgi:hypothetical protein